MAEIVWGAEPEFFGPRHAYREGRITGALDRLWLHSGPHLECAAGVGSLSLTVARSGRVVIAADASLRSLDVVRRRAAAAGLADSVLTVVADITHLPVADGTFATASTAETLEHIPDHEAAARELGRALRPGGSLVGTVPAGPEQWSDWDDWAGHLRRYTVDTMSALLSGAGLEPRVIRWGWPLLRLYDDVFLRRINRRRLGISATVDEDSTLRTVSALGRRLWLVRAVKAVFGFDRLFDGAPWGVGLLFSARKPNPDRE